MPSLVAAAGTGDRLSHQKPARNLQLRRVDDALLIHRFERRLRRNHVQLPPCSSRRTGRIRAFIGRCGMESIRWIGRALRWRRTRRPGASEYGIGSGWWMRKASSTLRNWLVDEKSVIHPTRLEFERRSLQQRTLPRSRLVPSRQARCGALRSVAMTLRELRCTNGLVTTGGIFCPPALHVLLRPALEPSLGTGVGVGLDVHHGLAASVI